MKKYDAKIDWSPVKSEYISSKISYRDLAKKYNISMRTLADKAKKEKWVELRERNQDKIVTKMIATEARKQIDRYTRMLNVTDKLLTKIEASIEALDAEGVTIDKAGIKALSGAIKDIKEIQGLKSEMDKMEQQARIKKLQKEAEDEKQDNTIRIEIAGGDEPWRS